MNSYDLDLAFRVTAKRAREARALERKATLEQLLADTKANLLILRTLDNIPITDAQIDDRANNLVMALLGSYRIERMKP